jgi:hypothetical protein
MLLAGAALILLGAGIGLGYLLYWVFGVAYESIPVPLRIAIVAVGIGVILLLLFIMRDRYRASKEEDFGGMDT